MKKFGLLGCGNIGSIICGSDIGHNIQALFDKEYERAIGLSQQQPGSSAHNEFELFIEQEYELVIEAASIEAVHVYGEKILESGRDLVTLSVGAFADEKFRQRMESAARSNDSIIHIPSGAIFGLDNIKIAQISQTDRLLLITTKPPRSLGVDVSERTQLFRGPAQEAIKQFPKNINVAVSLSMAAGAEAMVEIWADPETEGNIHQIIFEGAFGKASIKTQNLPSPDNPATSYLAALSVLTLLKNLDAPFRIGT